MFEASQKGVGKLSCTRACTGAPPSRGICRCQCLPRYVAPDSVWVSSPSKREAVVGAGGNPSVWSILAKCYVGRRVRRRISS